jgi:hypothetical protein
MPRPPERRERLVTLKTTAEAVVPSERHRSEALAIAVTLAS